MKSNPFGGTARPSLPTVSDIERRMFELSSQSTGGRPSTLWSAIPESEGLAGEEFQDESTAEETANEESMQQQT